MKRIYKLVLDVYAVHAVDLVENHNLEVKNPYLHLAKAGHIKYPMFILS